MLRSGQYEKVASRAEWSNAVGWSIQESDQQSSGSCCEVVNTTK